MKGLLWNLWSAWVLYTRFGIRLSYHKGEHNEWVRLLSALSDMPVQNVPDIVRVDHKDGSANIVASGNGKQEFIAWFSPEYAKRVRWFFFSSKYFFWRRWTQSDEAVQRQKAKIRARMAKAKKDEGGGYVH